MTMPFKRDLKARGKSPHVVHVRRSYPILVRDGILDRIKLMPFFATFKFGKTAAIPIQAPMLPYCAVYFLNDQETPDGDANAGEVRFKTVARIGISVIIQNNDPEEADLVLDTAYQVLVTNLFADHTLYDNDIFKIQAFISGTRQHIFGNAGKDQETPIAELRYEIGCDLGVVTYPPYVPDDLEQIHVKTRWPGGGTEQEIAATQQVESNYDIGVEGS